MQWVTRNKGKEMDQALRSTVEVHSLLLQI